MSVDFNVLADLVDELDTAISQKAFSVPLVMDISTPVADQQVNVLRNRVITSLRSAFITDTGHLNTPLFLMFCHTFGFEYRSVDSGPSTPGFTLKNGSVALVVR